MPQEIIGPLLSIGAALELPVIGYVLLALVLAGVVSFATTPLVKDRSTSSWEIVTPSPLLTNAIISESSRKL